ncbi:MAG: hypothetical protein JWQ83_1303 [Lacunisphaera sp.]|nr:hypothetical protein [Lacunisphaera sp.]MDB6166163.1 hypothetical protein [Lacunisphaera sp.]
MQLKTATLLFAAGLLLGGCASFEGNVDKTHDLAGIQRFFVVSNSNDNHALDHRIAEALVSRGHTAESGPLTMMPDNAQAVVTFQDRWTWDFGEHLVFLKISVRNPDDTFPFGSATFEARVPSRDPLPVIVGRLADQLLKENKK